MLLLIIGIGTSSTRGSVRGVFVSDISTSLSSLMKNREGLPFLVGDCGIHIAAPVSSVIKILLWREGILFPSFWDNGGDISVTSSSGEVTIYYLLFIDFPIELFWHDDIDILAESFEA